MVMPWEAEYLLWIMCPLQGSIIATINIINSITAITPETSPHQWLGRWQLTPVKCSLQHARLHFKPLTCMNAFLYTTTLRDWYCDYPCATDEKAEIQGICPTSELISDRAGIEPEPLLQSPALLHSVATCLPYKANWTGANLEEQIKCKWRLREGKMKSAGSWFGRAIWGCPRNKACSCKICSSFCMRRSSVNKAKSIFCGIAQQWVTSWALPDLYQSVR